MPATSRLRTRLPVLLVWSLIATAIAGVAWFDAQLRDAGRADLVQLTDPATLVIVVAGLSSAAVGGLLAQRREDHPVGWLLLALGASIPLSGLAAGAALRALALHPSEPGTTASTAALLADQVPVLWHVLLTLVLLLTPAGRLQSRVQRWTARVSVGSGVALSAALCLSTDPLDAPFDGLTSPLASESLAGPVAAVRGAALTLLLLGVLVALVGLVLRAVRGDPDERRQLSWMLVVTPPAVGLLLVAAAASLLHAEQLLAVSAGAFLGLVPAAVALAVARHQLYDVPRLLSRSASYVLLTSLTVLLYLGGVATVGLLLGRAAGRSPAASVIATVIAVSVAWPLRGRLQDAVDRRFSRRRFAARAVVRDYVAAPPPGTTIEQVLRQATGDPSLSVALPVGGVWVSEDGDPSGGSGRLVVERRGGPVARLDWDSAPEDIVAAVVDDALPELDAARLRAALAVQLVEVRASRARIVQAQADERHRIERDLHDGVQQRLLALALSLKTAAPERQTLDRAVDEIAELLREVRSLAQGLQPADLAAGGLSAALDGLAARLPLSVTLEVTARRYAEHVEAAGWFIACEAVANAVKHASAERLHICVEEHEGQLVVSVDDDGKGGADPRGSGLQGIADRAAAAGGHLVCEPSPLGGTRVRGVLPCAS